VSSLETIKLPAVLLGIALAALAVRIIPVVARGDLRWSMEPNGDSATYLSLANGLRRGCGFARPAGDLCDTAPETNRTPGYPVFLWLIPGLYSALIAQALLWSLVCFFVGLFAGAVAGRRAGYCAAAIIAADVPSIVASNEIMSETLFTALLSGAVLAELETLRTGGSSPKLYGLLAFASAMLGLALLVRPIGVFVIPVAIIAPMLLHRASRSRRFVVAVVVAAGPVLCATAWSLRNYSVAGVSSLSTISSLDFFYYRAVGTLAFASRAGWVETLGQTRSVAISGLSAQAFEIILHHPFAFIAMTLWSFFYVCWVPDRAPLAQFLGMPSVLRFQDPGSVRIEALIQRMWTGNFAGLSTIFAQELHSSLTLLLLVSLQLVIIVFTWAGVAFALRRYGCQHSPLRACVLFTFAIAVVALLAASGPEAVARFRVPATPLLAFLAGVGWFGSSKTEQN
jgi:hypothetical protein